MTTKLQNLRTENNGYRIPVVELFYKQCPKIKMNKSTFEREIKAALALGSLNACQVILNNHKHDPFKSVEEMQGFIQETILECYKDTRKILGLRIDSMDLSEIIERCEPGKNDAK